MSRKLRTSIGALVGAAAIAGIAMSFNTSAAPSEGTATPIAMAPIVPKKINTLHDIHGIDLPRCFDDKGYKVEFLPKEHSYFPKRNKLLFSLEADPFGDGAFIYYDYEDLLKYPKEYRTHLLYTECARYALDDGTVKNLSPKAWQAFGYKAECVALQKMRADRPYTPEQMQQLVLDVKKYAFFMQGDDRTASIIKCLAAPPQPA